MSDANFRKCLDHVLKFEGGFVNHPKDPGGATNMGITKRTLEGYLGRSVTVEQVRNLSAETAGAIYRSKYWDVVKAGSMPDGIDLVAFDGAVNSGTGRGVKWLQGAVGVAQDGIVGPATLAAVHRADGLAVIRRACAARLGFLQRIKHRKTGARLWDTFGRGWGRRVAAVEAEAVAMYARSPVAVELERNKAAVAQKQSGATAGTAGVGAFASAGTDMPDWAFMAIGVAAAVIVALAVLRMIRHSDRVAAFNAKLEA